MAIDPTNPNRVYVAALGHVYDANPDRGVYRSLDGGATWKKILNHSSDPNNVGAIDLAIDPKNPRVLYATLWATRRPPWSVYAPSNMPGGGLYKSVDGGDTWKQLTGDDCPTTSSLANQNRHHPATIRTVCGRWWMISARASRVP